MSDQATFDALWRSDDPDVSVAAALSVDLSAREQEVMQALRWLIAASDTHDIQAVLAEHSMARDRNCIARRLTSLERRGRVRRGGVKTGVHGRSTTLWMLA